MSVIDPTLSAMPLRELWERAPIWRIAAVLASVLTALFLLFPPSAAAPGRAGPPADAASFDPAAAFGDVTATSPRQPPAATSLHTEASSAPSTAAATPVTVPPTATARSGAPRSALLSMVSAGPGDRVGATGLDRAMTGQLYTGSITTDGFTLPLPPGQWAVLARNTARTSTASGMAYYLGRIENRRLVGAVSFLALRNAPNVTGFPQSQLCAHINPQRLFVSVEGALDPAGHQACWSINSYYAQSLGAWADKGMPLDGLERAAAGDLAAKGVSYPQDLVEVRLTRSDRSQFLEANYLFSPEAAGIASRPAPSALDSDWAAANVVRFPAKIAYLAKLEAWGDAFWPRFEDAFTRGMAAAAA